MRVVVEIIKDGDWCISRTGHSYLISVEDWQTLKAAVFVQQTNNNGSTPCRFFARNKVLTGKSADGGKMYLSVPWCNHEPSQRAAP